MRTRLLQAAGGVVAIGLGVLYVRWGAMAVLYGLIGLFWLAVIASIVGGLRRDRAARQALVAPAAPERVGIRMARGAGGCGLLLVGSVLVLAAALPTVALQPYINPRDWLLLNAFVLCLWAVPGAAVMGAGTGLLTMERTNRPQFDWRSLQHPVMVLFMLVVSSLVFPIALGAIVFLYVADRVRFRGGQPRVPESVPPPPPMPPLVDE